MEGFFLPWRLEEPLVLLDVICAVRLSVIEGDYPPSNVELASEDFTNPTGSADDWKQEDISFVAPSSGKVTLRVQCIGPGQKDLAPPIWNTWLFIKNVSLT